MEMYRNNFYDLKVVIPRTVCRHEKMVFSTPRSQYEGYGHDIWGERTSDDPFQVSNVKLFGGSTLGQQLLTKVSRMSKNALFELNKKYNQHLKTRF